MIFPSPWMTFGPPAVPFVQPPGGNWGHANLSPTRIVQPITTYRETVIVPGQTEAFDNNG